MRTRSLGKVSRPTHLFKDVCRMRELMRLAMWWESMPRLNGMRVLEGSLYDFSTAEVEDRLRTHLTAGMGLDEIIAQLNEAPNPSP